MHTADMCESIIPQKMKSRWCTRSPWRPFRQAPYQRRGEDPKWYRDVRTEALAGRLRGPLDGRGFEVIDGLLTGAEATSICHEMERFFVEEGTSPETLTHRQGMRSDQFASTSEHEASRLGLPRLAAAIRMLKSLGHALSVAMNGSMGRLTLPPRVQMACYNGGGSYYRRHTDNMPANPSAITRIPSNLKEQLLAFDLRSWRAFTVILYFNDRWDGGTNGGALRLHHETGGHTDVAPLAGRAIFFNSLHQHEVRPTHGRTRWALTMWMWLEDGDDDKFDAS